MAKNNTVKATCIACGKQFWATEAYVANVQAGKEESLCGYCDKSHDDEGGDACGTTAEKSV